MTPINHALLLLGTILALQFALQCHGAISSGTSYSVPIFPPGIFVSSADKSLFYAYFMDNTVNAFTVNADGSLTQRASSSLAPSVATTNTFDLSNAILSPDSKFLYVPSDSSPQTLWVYSRNTADSSLTVQDNLKVTLPRAPDTPMRQLIIGNDFYLTGAGTSVYHFTRNSATGALSLVGSYPLPSNTILINHIVASPDGAFIYVDANIALSRDLNTGALTKVNIKPKEIVSGIAFSDDGTTAYMWYQYTVYSARRDVSSGSLSASFQKMDLQSTHLVTSVVVVGNNVFAITSYSIEYMTRDSSGWLTFQNFLSTANTGDTAIVTAQGFGFVQDWTSTSITRFNYSPDPVSASPTISNSASGTPAVSPPKSPKSHISSSKSPKSRVSSSKSPKAPKPSASPPFAASSCSSLRSSSKCKKQKKVCSWKHKKCVPKKH